MNGVYSPCYDFFITLPIVFVVNILTNGCASFNLLSIAVSMFAYDFLSQTLWHFHKNIRSCVEMNAVASTQLTLQILTHQYSQSWDSKCLAIVAQMVRVFGMTPEVGGSCPPQVETFSVSKTVLQEHPFVCRKWMLLLGTVGISNVNFTLK